MSQQDNNNKTLSSTVVNFLKTTRTIQPTNSCTLEVRSSFKH